MAARVASSSSGQASTTSTSSAGSSRVAFWVAVWGREGAVPGGCWRDSAGGGASAFETQTPETAGLWRSPAASGVDSAERGGFEPPIRFDTYNGLANSNCCERKCLTHPGVYGRIDPHSSHPVPTTPFKTPANLSEVVDAWPSLDDATRAAILSLVRGRADEGE